MKKLFSILLILCLLPLSVFGYDLKVNGGELRVVGGSVVVSAAPSFATPTLRQAYSTYVGNAQTGVVVVTGDLIVVGYSYNSLTVLSTTCSDNAGGGTNTYNQVGAGVAGNDGGGGVAAHMFYAVAKASETLTVTCTAQSDNGIHVHVVSGMNQTLADVLDNSALLFDSSSSTSHTTTGIATANANDYILVYWANENCWITITENGAGFVSRSEQNSHCSATFDRTVTSTGTYSDSVTFGVAKMVASIIAAFKAKVL